MSTRLEWATAASVRPMAHVQGEQLDDGNTVTEPIAVSVGGLVIEGSFEELARLAVQFASTVSVAGERALKLGIVSLTEQPPDR